MPHGPRLEARSATAPTGMAGRLNRVRTRPFLPGAGFEFGLDGSDRLAAGGIHPVRRRPAGSAYSGELDDVLEKRKARVRADAPHPVLQRGGVEGPAGAAEAADEVMLVPVGGPRPVLARAVRVKKDIRSATDLHVMERPVNGGEADPHSPGHRQGVQLLRRQELATVRENVLNHRAAPDRSRTERNVRLPLTPPTSHGGSPRTIWLPIDPPHRRRQ